MAFTIYAGTIADPHRFITLTPPANPEENFKVQQMVLNFIKDQNPNSLSPKDMQIFPAFFYMIQPRLNELTYELLDQPDTVHKVTVFGNTNILKLTPRLSPPTVPSSPVSSSEDLTSTKSIQLNHLNNRVVKDKVYRHINKNQIKKDPINEGQKIPFVPDLDKDPMLTAFLHSNNLTNVAFRFSTDLTGANTVEYTLHKKKKENCTIS